MILGHLTSTVLIRDLAGEKFPRFISLPLLIVGAYTPDLMDKPLHIFLTLPSRGLFHSFLVLTVFWGLLACIFRNRFPFFLTLWLGGILHLVQDLATPKIVFWPLLGSWDPSSSHSIWTSVVHFYLHRDPFILWAAEMISGIYCLGLAIHWTVGWVGSVLEGSPPIPADSE